MLAFRQKSSTSLPQNQNMGNINTTNSCLLLITQSYLERTAGRNLRSLPNKVLYTNEKPIRVWNVDSIIVVHIKWRGRGTL